MPNPNRLTDSTIAALYDAGYRYNPVRKIIMDKQGVALSTTISSIVRFREYQVQKEYENQAVSIKRAAMRRGE